MADSVTATQENESADNPHIDEINAEVDGSLAGELDEDDEPTGVQAEIIEPHPDWAVNNIGLWIDYLSQDDEPTDVQAEIIEPHPDWAVNNIGLWPDHLSQELVDYWAKKGAIDLQHCADKLLKLKSSHRCTPSMCERQNRNGEFMKLSWLCFSPVFAMFANS